MSSNDRDPVRAAFEGQVDLYDVATWDVRSTLDVLAVAVYNSLHSMKRWVLILAALAFFIVDLLFIGLLMLDAPFLGVLGALSVLPALFLAVYLWYEDPTRREPLSALAITFLLAVLFATFAAIVNTALLPLFSVVPVVGLTAFFFLVVGPIEETVKWLAVRVHAYNSDSFDAVVDGVVYGAVAGLGFAAIENTIYIVETYLQTVQAGGVLQVRYTLQTATARAFAGPGHVIYSAFAGYYLGLAKYNPDRRGPIVVKGLLVAVFIHALYNTLVSYLPLPGLSFIAFIVVYDGFWLAVLVRKLSRYRTYYRQALDAGGTAAAPEER